MSRLPSNRGFTLLEICLALAIALTVMAMAAPGLISAMEGSAQEKSFERLDAMAREARQRSQAERRNYVIVWGNSQPNRPWERVLVMRPEAAKDEAEAEGFQRWEIGKSETLEMELPAALLSKGTRPEAIWTFWPNGVCEPAQIRYHGAAGGWRARYHPLTGSAEVQYE